MVLYLWRQKTGRFLLQNPKANNAIVKHRKARVYMGQLPQINNNESLTDNRTRLLAALAEELKLPLLQIAHKSQLARRNNDIAQLADIETTAEASLRLIDSYLFTTQTLMGQQRLDLQPVSVEATMHDVANYLDKIAKLYDCKLEVKSTRRLGLVMAHPEGLRAALTSLVYSFITSSTGAEQNTIVLNAAMSKSGVEAGVFAQEKAFQKNAMKRARELFGKARQPFTGLGHSNGAGIYVAETLFLAMAASGIEVKTRRHAGGLCATMLPSRQLSLL
jgi:hypothetical protein